MYLLNSSSLPYIIHLLTGRYAEVPVRFSGTFYYFLIATYYYLCISQTLYVPIVLSEQIKKFLNFFGYQTLETV